MSVIAAERARVAPDSNEERVLDATLRCIAHAGIAKTTLDEIAREARVSRATLYRTFPGGKDVLLASVLTHEVQRFFEVVNGRLEACDGLEDVLVAGITETARFLEDHAALSHVLEHEPDLVVAHLAFHRLDPVVRLATDFATPHLARFLGRDEAAEVAEWAVRTVISYSLHPSDRVELADPASVGRLVSTYLLGFRSRTKSPQPTRSSP